MLWSEILAFIDDIALPSKSVEQGIELLQPVFDRIGHADRQLKAAKYRLFQTEAKIFNLVDSDGNVYEDSSRVEAFQSLQFL
jgi:hypothetical protein